jgi:hypothetical protein
MPGFKKVLNAATMKLGASVLPVVGAYCSPVVSLMFSFSVLRRFPAEVLDLYGA